MYPSRAAFVALLLVFFGLGLFAAPACGGVLRYQDPWTRPNGERQAPSWQASDHDGDGIPNMYDSQEAPQDPPLPSVDFPQSDRPPMRFDTYEDNWYDRM